MVNLARKSPLSPRRLPPASFGTHNRDPHLTLILEADAPVLTSNSLRSHPTTWSQHLVTRPWLLERVEGGKQEATKAGARTILIAGILTLGWRAIVRPDLTLQLNVSREVWSL